MSTSARYTHGLQIRKAMEASSPAHEVGEATCYSRAEDGIAREHGILVVHAIAIRVRVLNFCLEDDSHNDTIDGHGFTENDAACMGHNRFR